MVGTSSRMGAAGMGRLAAQAAAACLPAPPRCRAAAISHVCHCLPPVLFRQPPAPPQLKRPPPCAPCPAPPALRPLPCAPCSYPHALFFLDLLQTPEFRAKIANPAYKELVHTQQYWYWQHARANRVREKAAEQQQRQAAAGGGQQQGAAGAGGVQQQQGSAAMDVEEQQPQQQPG